MNLQRKEQLEALYRELMAARIELIATEQVRGACTAADAAKQLEDLAEIGACIGTAWLATNLGNPGGAK